MVSLFTAEDKGTLVARFQETGTFDINIVGNIKNGHATLQVPMCLMSYRVNVSNPTKQPSLPGEPNGIWGVQREFLDAGFKLLYPEDCLIKASSGQAIIKLQLPTNAFFSGMHRLYMTEDGYTKSEFNRYVIAEQSGNIMTYDVQCPKAGEYKLEIYASYKNSRGYHIGAGVLITCTQPLDNPNKDFGFGPGLYDFM